MTSPVISQLKPYMVEVEAGKTYYWCSCGLSKKQPFCDGSHAGTNLVPLPYKANETKTIAMCGCKYSGVKPLCDGAHSKL